MWNPSRTPCRLAGRRPRPPKVPDRLAPLAVEHEGHDRAELAAVELFMRTSLIEGGLDERRVTTLDFREVIGETRKRLDWNIPKHYNSGDTTRLVRNAVAHGSETPTKDNVEFRLLFDKWRLFLFRRILIRLGYQGDVVSPHKGWLDSSAANDFTEARNSFDTRDADSHPFAQFVTHLREHFKTDGGP